MIVFSCLLLALMTAGGAMAAFSARAVTWGSVLRGILLMLPSLAMLLVSLSSFRIWIGDDGPPNVRIWFPPLGPLTLATFFVSLLFGARAGIRAAHEYKSNP